LLLNNKITIKLPNLETLDVFKISEISEYHKLGDFHWSPMSTKYKEGNLIYQFNIETVKHIKMFIYYIS